MRLLGLSAIQRSERFSQRRGRQRCRDAPRMHALSNYAAEHAATFAAVGGLRQYRPAP